MSLRVFVDLTFVMLTDCWLHCLVVGTRAVAGLYLVGNGLQVRELNESYPPILWYKLLTFRVGVCRSFDQIAKKRRVFKVETVGDCYVAVAGLPDPREDHAMVMARFARECLAQMNLLVKKLEVNLGPDTGDLGLRIGLHSGPVTAGVLRGERSRFQLFGDTINVASRMESTGSPGRIHLSRESARLLKEAGKGDWLLQRKGEFSRRL